MGERSQPPVVGSFWSELKRRRVIRVVVLYAVAGWIVIEVASTVLPNLNLPDWSVTLVTALVALGFVLAVVLAWAFDTGPDGLRRTPDLAAQAPTNPATATADAAAASETETPKARPRADPRKSIAVLPFVNMSGEAENEYFSDGISEEILNLLVKLPGCGLPPGHPRSC